MCYNFIESESLMCLKIKICLVSFMETSSITPFFLFLLLLLLLSFENTSQFLHFLKPFCQNSKRPTLLKIRIYIRTLQKQISCEFFMPKCCVHCYYFRPQHQPYISLPWQLAITRIFVVNLFYISFFFS
jgi:hypothetical protein